PLGNLCAHAFNLDARELESSTGHVAIGPEPPIANPFLATHRRAWPASWTECSDWSASGHLSLVFGS
ncbi:MAG: hypothetical protein VX668_02690, partial [Planctomycetota bacterium]|nr:hypothetical protein [Planctomycetota bacterium]